MDQPAHIAVVTLALLTRQHNSMATHCGEFFCFDKQSATRSVALHIDRTFKNLSGASVRGGTHPESRTRVPHTTCRQDLLRGCSHSLARTVLQRSAQSSPGSQVEADGSSLQKRPANPEQQYGRSGLIATQHSSVGTGAAFRPCVTSTAPRSVRVSVSRGIIHICPGVIDLMKFRVVWNISRDRLLKAPAATARLEFRSLHYLEIVLPLVDTKPIKSQANPEGNGPQRSGPRGHNLAGLMLLFVLQPSLQAAAPHDTFPAVRT